MKKSKFKKNKLLLLFVPCLLLLFVTGCKDSKKQSESFKKMYRFVDHLSEQNIIHSPLEDIVKKFPFVKEDISRPWQFIRELSDKNLETWAVSTNHPVLGDAGAKPGKGTRLLRNGEEVDYLSPGTVQENAYRWIKTGEVLDLSTKKDYSNRRKGIILDPAHPFKFRKLLPEGKVVLSINIERSATAAHDVAKRYSSQKKYRPVLIISFNDKYKKRIRLKRPKRKLYMFRKKVEQGFYDIEIKMIGDENTADGAGKNYAVIRNVSINSHSDVLLFTKKTGGGKNPPPGKFSIEYYSIESPGDNDYQARILKALYLYRLKDRFPILDSGVGANPFSIKKKLSIGETSANVLAAPYPSEYAFRLKIPPRCKLEFGCGILNEDIKSATSNELVNFKVAVTAAGEQKSLYDEKITPSFQQEIKSKEIDLSSFEGKDISLSFMTELVKPGDKKGYKNAPFWINPVVYQTANDDDMNIVLISLDTVRPDYLGCYGYAKDTSPAVDKLAEDAVLFLNAYSATSWTLPAHISLLTALDCIHHQVYYPYDEMDPGHLTLAEILRSKFYSAAFTGGGFLSSTYGFAQGFDEYHELGAQNKEAIRSDEAEFLAGQSLDFINDNKNKRFFLFLHTYQPHDPYINPSPAGKRFLPEDPKWRQVSLVDLFKETGRFNRSFSEQEKKNIRALYEGELCYTDEVYVKPIIARLKELNLYDKTMIILLSDHGEEFYDHESWLHDHSLYEEAIKIPLLIKFPDSRNKGRRIKNIVRITDVLPTILAEANIEAGAYPFDGMSLLPIIKGEEKKNRNFFCDLALRGLKAPKIITMNKGNFKFILNEKAVSPHVKKVVKDLAGYKVELYDLDKDPHEKINLAGQARYHKMCIDMIKEIKAIYKDVQQKPGKRKKVKMDKSLIEKLKALGYIK